MKIFILSALAFPVMVLAQTSTLPNSYGDLKQEDQKFFKNSSMEGNNQFERIDLNVKEINKLHAKINSLENELLLLKNEVAELKKKK